MNRFLRNCLFLLVLVATLPTMAHARTSKELDAVLDLMQDAYDKAAGYSATFVQRTGTAGSSSPRISKGQVHFAKPGKMKWLYAEPQRKFISDGVTFWMVQDDRKEVVVSDVKKMFGNKTPMAFLTGMGKIRKEFNPSLISKDDTSAVLKLALKEPTTQAQYLQVTVNLKTGLAEAVRTVDFFGSYNEISFSKYKLNPAFAKDFFQYVVPRGYRTVQPQESMPQQR